MDAINETVHSTDTATIGDNANPLDRAATAIENVMRKGDAAGLAELGLIEALYNSHEGFTLRDLAENERVYTADKSKLMSTRALHLGWLRAFSPLFVENEKIVKRERARKAATKQNIFTFDTAPKAAASDKKASKQERENNAVIKMMRSAARIAFTFEQLNSTAMSVASNEKAMQFNAADGRIVFVTLARMKKTQTEWFKANNPFVRLAQDSSDTSDGDGADKSTLATHVKAAPLDAAATLSAEIQTSVKDAREKLVNAAETETLLCNLLAAKFMRDKTLDLTAFGTWLSVQTYFKTDGHSVAGTIVAERKAKRA